MRKLKFHEKKLLKKTDFLDWKKEHNGHEIKVVRRYHLQDREDYTRYNRICGVIMRLVLKLKELKQNDLFRIKITEQLLDKMYNMGIISSKKSLELCEKVTVSAFCRYLVYKYDTENNRRRLPVMLKQLKFAESVREAVTFIEQGHVRIGTDVCTDPALLVTRNMEDHITWVDSSAIKKKIMKYNDKLDDYDLLE